MAVDNVCRQQRDGANATPQMNTNIGISASPFQTDSFYDITPKTVNFCTHRKSAKLIVLKSYGFANTLINP